MAVDEEGRFLRTVFLPTWLLGVEVDRDLERFNSRVIQSNEGIMSLCVSETSILVALESTQRLLKNKTITH